MAELKYTPVLHNQKEFLAKARARKGFNEAYDALELEYQVAGQMLKARSRAGLTQDAVAERVDRDAAGEIEILLAVLTEEVRALASDRTHATPRVDGHERGDGHRRFLFETRRAARNGPPRRRLIPGTGAQRQHRGTRMMLCPILTSRRSPLAAPRPCAHYSPRLRPMSRTRRPESSRVPIDRR